MTDATAKNASGVEGPDEPGRGTKRPRFTVDFDLRHDEVQIYDRARCRVAAVFYRHGTTPFLGQIACNACDAMNHHARLREPASASDPERARETEWPEEFPCPWCGVWMGVDDDYRRVWCSLCGHWIDKPGIKGASATAKNASGVEGPDEPEQETIVHVVAERGAIMLDVFSTRALAEEQARAMDPHVIVQSLRVWDRVWLDDDPASANEEAS